MADISLFFAVFQERINILKSWAILHFSLWVILHLWFGRFCTFFLGDSALCTIAQNFWAIFHLNNFGRFFIVHNRPNLQHVKSPKLKMQNRPKIFSEISGRFFIFGFWAIWFWAIIHSAIVDRQCQYIKVSF